MKNKKTKLPELQEILIGLLSHELKPASYFFKLIPHNANITNINSVYSAFERLSKANKIWREKVNGKWYYRAIVFNGKTKSKNMANKTRKVNKNVLYFLCENIGKEFGASAIAEKFGFNTLSNTSMDLKALFKAGCLRSNLKKPIIYTVLETIANYDINTNAILNKVSPNLALPVSPLDAMQPQQLPAPIPLNQNQGTVNVLPDVIDSDINHTVNTIIKLQQQNTIYKAALEHIAGILEQAGIIETA